MSIAKLCYLYTFITGLASVLGFADLTWQQIWIPSIIVGTLQLLGEFSKSVKEYKK